MKITISIECVSDIEAKHVIDRLNDNTPITDDMIRDYLVRKGWWKAETLDHSSPRNRLTPREDEEMNALLQGRSPETDEGVNAYEPPHDTRQPIQLGGPTTQQLGPYPVVRGNVNPGEPSIAKIGQTARDLIFTALGVGAQPSLKHMEHCKLLWKRGEVKFDGEAYYL